jgi:hypothetical protein
MQGRQAKRQQEQERAAMMANAEAMRQSPWTGMQTSMINPTAPNRSDAALGGALSGAVSGLSLAQGMKQTDALNKLAENRAVEPKPSMYSSQPLPEMDEFNTWYAMRR